VADRGSHLVPVVRVIARALFSDTVIRQAEEVTKAGDGEDGREWPPLCGPGRDRDGHAGERGDHGDLPGQGPRPLGDKLLALISPGTSHAAA
jgi:hypothetical protein